MTDIIYIDIIFLLGILIIFRNLILENPNITFLYILIK